MTGAGEAKARPSIPIRSLAPPGRVLTPRGNRDTRAQRTILCFFLCVSASLWPSGASLWPGTFRVLAELSLPDIHVQPPDGPVQLGADFPDPVFDAAVDRLAAQHHFVDRVGPERPLQLVERAAHRHAPDPPLRLHRGVV